MSTAPGLDRVFREEHGRVVATLTRRLGDLDVAEEAAQEAYLIALQRWPESGVPPNPGAWLTTTAYNRAIDRIRRESSRDARQAQAAMISDTDDDDFGTGLVRGGRPAPADVHLLPPRPGDRHPGRAHPAAARRPDGRRDRQRLPRRRARDGQAADQGQAEDQGGADPLPGAAGRRAAGPPARGPGHAVPGLQRGLPALDGRAGPHGPRTAARQPNSARPATGPRTARSAPTCAQKRSD